MRAHGERFQAVIEREEWEARHPDEAAKQRAEDERFVREIRGLRELSDNPRRAAHLRRCQELQARADRCSECERPFTPGETIYRRALRGDAGGPVLPYCSEHRCPQQAGQHNDDVPDGYYKRGCRCGDYGDRQWRKPKPCAGCGRLVANDKRTADPHRFTRQWAYTGERELAARVFCSTHCRRSTFRAEAKAKRERKPRKCECCPATFTPSRADSRYCSAACRQRAYRERRAA